MSDGRSVRTIISICLAAFVLVGVTGCGSQGATGGSSSGTDASGGSGSSAGSGSSGTGLAPSEDAELDKGRVLVESKCDMCHTLDRIKSASKDADGWTQAVERMRGHGAVLTDQEAQQIVDYLASR